MRPQDIDSRGNVALLDTATDEVKHVPAHIAQETLSRNPAGEAGEGRFRVMEAGTAEALADPEKRRLQIAQERRLQTFEGEAGGHIVHGDATDLYSGRHSSPLAMPSADTPAVAPARPADPDKAKAQREKDQELIAENTKANETRGKS